MLECRRRWTSSSSREQIHPCLAFCFLFRPSTDWMMPACSLPIRTLVSETASRPHLKQCLINYSQHPTVIDDKVSHHISLLQEGLWLLPDITLLHEREEERSKFTFGLDHAYESRSCNKNSHPLLSAFYVYLNLLRCIWFYLRLHRPPAAGRFFQLQLVGPLSLQCVLFLWALLFLAEHGPRAPGSVARSVGLAAPGQGGSSQTGSQTRVPCICRWALYG